MASDKPHTYPLWRRVVDHWAGRLMVVITGLSLIPLVMGIWWWDVTKWIVFGILVIPAVVLVVFLIIYFICVIIATIYWISTGDWYDPMDFGPWA